MATKRTPSPEWENIGPQLLILHLALKELTY